MLPVVETELLRVLADMTNMPPATLRSLSVQPLRPQVVRLPKGDGTWRVIRKSHPRMKQIQQALLTLFAGTPALQPSLHAFAGRGRGLRRNAEQHRGAQTVLSLDLHDFFGSCTKSMVREELQRRGFGAVAPLICGWCCAAGALPQGAPTSSFLADLVATRLDDCLVLHAGELGAVYTRYVDDLTFSWRCVLTRPQRRRRSRRLKAAVRALGWRLAPEKTRWRDDHDRLTVVGVVVNAPFAPRAPRLFRRRLRAALHNPRGRWDADAVQGAQAFVAMFQEGSKC